MRGFFLKALLAPSLLATGSCGGGLAQQGVLNEGNAQMMASQFKTLIGQLKFDQSPTLPQGIPGGVTISSVSPAAVDPCITVTPDPGVDLDNDGMAAEKHYTFNCDSLTSGGDVWSYQGTMKSYDLDDTKRWIQGGYRIEYDTTSAYQGTSGIGAYGSQGYWHAYVEGSSYRHDMDYTFNIKATYEGYPEEVDYILRAKWEMSITPSNEANPWMVGVLDATGLYQFKGRFIDESASGGHQLVTGSTVLSFKAEALEYDSSCAVFYKGGSWFFTDSAGAVLEMRYECATVKAYLDGVEFNI